MKRWQGMAAAVGLLLACTACTGRAALIGTGYGVPGQAAPADRTEAPSALPEGLEPYALPAEGVDDFLALKMNWISEQGIYDISIPDEVLEEMQRRYEEAEKSGGGMAVSRDEKTRPLLLHFTDRRTGRRIVLCNKPNCAHEDAACPAAMPGEVSASGGSYMSDLIFGEGGSLYVVGNKQIFKLNTDATGRAEVMRLPDEYEYNSGVDYYRGKLYLGAMKPIPNPDKDSEYSVVSVNAMIEVDYKNKTWRELWAMEPLDRTLIKLGIWNGRHYYRDLDEPRQGGYSQTAYDRMRANTVNRIYTMDIATGKREVIYEAGEPDFDCLTVDGRASLLYHSRNEEALMRLNLETLESVKLAGGLKGYMWIGAELDGKRLIQWERSSHDIFRDPAPVPILYYYDPGTGTAQEVPVTVEKNIGDPDPVTIIKEEDGYFYFAFEKEIKLEKPCDVTFEELIRAHIGRIKKEDFWAGRTERIEPLEWVERNAYWAMANESMKYAY